MTKGGNQSERWQMGLQTQQRFSCRGGRVALLGFGTILVIACNSLLGMDAELKLTSGAGGGTAGTGTTLGGAGVGGEDGGSGGVAVAVQDCALGGDHACALLVDGHVRCWGYNFYGQLGDGTAAERSTPIAVTALGIRELALGGDHTCVLLVDGVRCWGRNDYGQLGDGTAIQRNAPVAIAALGTSVKELALGGDHTCALLGDGSIRCWGANNFGQLGDGTNTRRNTPVAIAALGTSVKELALGGDHTCALLVDGSVRCWGYNFYGQLGDGSAVQQNSPVAVPALGIGVEQIALGATHTCALLVDGSVRCWGQNNYGQLGDGTATQRNTPVAVTALETGVKELALGVTHTCALLVDGSVRCWGQNSYGQLGDGTMVQRNSPVVVTELGNSVKQIALGDFHTCALKVDGSVRCWGVNNIGQLGDGTTDNRLVPTSPKW